MWVLTKVLTHARDYVLWAAIWNVNPKIVNIEELADDTHRWWSRKLVAFGHRWWSRRCGGVVWSRRELDSTEWENGRALTAGDYVRVYIYCRQWWCSYTRHDNRPNGSATCLQATIIGLVVARPILTPPEIGPPVSLRWVTKNTAITFRPGWRTGSHIMVPFSFRVQPFK
jgi:hypothetical protein